MMRLWANSYSKSTPVVTSATLSVVAHAVVIAAWVVSTMPAAEHAAGELREPNVSTFLRRTGTPGTRGSRETVHYVDLTQGRSGHRRWSANHRR